MESRLEAPAVVVPQAAAPAAEPSLWIAGRTFDLVFFFGGAVLSLAFLGLHFGLGVSIVALWWLWLLGFDGPHMMAAFTRTYVDREEWRSRPWVLSLSLLCFVVGPACLVVDRLAGGNHAFTSFLAIGALYGFYHVVRQHYGFLALYKSKARDHADFNLDKWFLYFGCWAPYGFFMLAHPRARTLMMMSSTPDTLFERAILTLLAASWLIGLVAWSARALRAPDRGARATKIAYMLTTVVLYGFIYFLLARLEPRYVESAGPDQDFLMISFMNTLTHNVQYVALVWFHNERRYSGDGDFGPARALNRSWWTYLLACAAFSGVYLALACWTQVFPGCPLFARGPQLAGATASQIGLSLWWGLALHHYVLDQKIWRIRGDATLKRNLGLA